MALLLHIVLLLLKLNGSINALTNQEAVDGPSCVCGLNREILDRLESIIKATPSTCSLPSLQLPSSGLSLSLVGAGQQLEGQQGGSSAGPQTQTTNLGESTDLEDSNQKPANNDHHNDGHHDSSSLSTSDDEHNSKNDQQEESKPPQTEGPADVGSSETPKSDDSYEGDFIAKLAAEIHKLEAQILSIKPQLSDSFQSASTTTNAADSSLNDNKPSIVAQLLQQITGGDHSGSLDHLSNGSVSIELTKPPPQAAIEQQQQVGNNRPSLNEKKGEPVTVVAGASGETSGSIGGNIGASVDVGGGFLIGLPTPENEALIKPSQSQKVDAQVVESAVESTVPGVVSNIFSNIESLVIQTEQHKQPDKSDNPGQLTSIDGNSVSVQGGTTAQMTAEGEKLFTSWIEHQLSNLHLTASMANYIRKNAVSLFRRIVRQYVERIGKIGGSLEDNVSRATQMALSNTQNLITFLLKNYLNVSGGLMQIIGEQVSRIGKQLDSTGDTIAHLSLNPLNIVTKVMDSLPNPADYSKYFRELSKQLMGGEASSSSSVSTTTGQQQTYNVDQATPTAGESENTQSSLITKTMGALSKTLSSWLGISLQDTTALIS